MYTKTVMAAMASLALYSILQAGPGQDGPSAESALATSSPAASAPAATSQPSETSALAAAIGAASDTASAAEAYARACKIYKNNAALHEAYMRRELQLGSPEMALYGARSLLALQPANPLARALIAYWEAHNNKLVDSMKDTLVVLEQLKDDPAVLNNAGQLIAWHDYFAKAARIPDFPQAAIDKLRDAFAASPAFAEPYAQVKDAGEKEQARKDDLTKKVAAAQDELDKIDAQAQAVVTAARAEHDTDVATAQRAYDDAQTNYNNWTAIHPVTDPLHPPTVPWSLVTALDTARKALDKAKAAPLNDHGQLAPLQTGHAAKTAAITNFKSQLAIVVMPAFRWETPSVDGVPTPKGHGQPGTTTATSRPSASQPSPAAVDPETLAARQLNMAKNYISASMKPKAVTLLTSILKDYPQTKAAKEARQMLDQISGQ